METLKHGDYCEVTREQAVELFTIEGEVKRPKEYADEFQYIYITLRMWFDSDVGVVLSGDEHGGHVNKISFPDFKQRLINTVNNK